MSLDEGLSRFIGSLYESVYDETAWNDALGEVLRRTACSHIQISSTDPARAGYSRKKVYGPEAYQFADGAQALEYSAPVDGLSLTIAFHPIAGDGPPGGETEALLRLVVHHLQRAIRLAARPPDFSRDSGAIIALERAGRVVAVSPRADELIRQGDGLALVDHHLAGPDDLAQAIAKAASPGLDGAAGGAVRIARSSGKADWLAMVSPYPRFLAHLPVPTPAAVVRIIEQESQMELTADQAALFGLTEREVDLVNQLLNGHSVESLSHTLGISRNTARVHLQSLFRKTATNRQADLIRILADIARN